jgi:protein-S-isoprenylcysteine O-methyltransferase Ste14
MKGNQVKGTGGVVYWIANLFFAVVVFGVVYLPAGTNRPMLTIGVIVAVLSVTLISLALYALRKYGKFGSDVSMFRPTILVRQNIYSVIRHPHYLGTMIMTVGLMAVSQHIVTLTAGLCATGLLLAQIGIEEEYCRAQFGEDYEKYTDTVPRFNVFAGMMRRMRKATT